MRMFLLSTTGKAQGVSQDSKSGSPKYVCGCRLVFGWSDKNMRFGMLLQFFVFTELHFNSVIFRHTLFSKG